MMEEPFFLNIGFRRLSESAVPMKGYSPEFVDEWSSDVVI